MLVYKFGGASVKDANGVRNLKSIIDACSEDLVVVISAMGKMTNAFEELVNAYFVGNEIESIKTKILEFHINIIRDLFYDNFTPSQFQQHWEALNYELSKATSFDFDFDYDRIVSFGELLSTSIVSEYLNSNETPNKWLDARQIIRTSNFYREAKVLWDVSADMAQKQISFKSHHCFITQGFLGSTLNNQTTTLGREGSDFTAATLAYILNAESVTIWKDVPGVLNADPKWFDNPELIPEISYKEATELTFYGAQIIHPKTLKPLQNKKIPLYVKSFLEPLLKGTKVFKGADYCDLPIYIKKDNQVLLTIFPTDFSFIVEDNIRDIFDIFSRHRAKVSLMQNSALSFSVCINYDSRRFDLMLEELKEVFSITYNLNVSLLTVRHYASNKTKDLVTGRNIFVEQKTRNTACYVIR